MDKSASDFKICHYCGEEDFYDNMHNLPEGYVCEYCYDKIYK